MFRRIRTLNFNGTIAHVIGTLRMFVSLGFRFYCQIFIEYTKSKKVIKLLSKYYVDDHPNDPPLPPLAGGCPDSNVS